MGDESSSREERFWREDGESIGMDADRASESSSVDRMTEGKAGVQVRPGEKATV